MTLVRLSPLVLSLGSAAMLGSVASPQALGARAPRPAYRMDLLPMPPGTNWGNAHEFSERGHVAAEYGVRNRFGTAYLQQADGTLQILLGPRNVEGVNDMGWTVGGAPPTFWTPGGVAGPFTLPPGLTGGWVGDINNHFQAVGRLHDGSGLFTGILWSDPLTPMVLPDLGGPSTFPLRLGDNGHVAGQATRRDGISVAYYYDGQKAVGLDPFGLGGAIFEAINDVGQAAGRGPSAVPAFPGFVGMQAFLYDRNLRRTTRLGFLGPWGYFTQSLGMNNAGHVVGFALLQRPGQPQRGAGFLWRDGRMRDLNALTVNLPAGANIISGKDIDERGRILVEVDLDPIQALNRPLAILTPLERAVAPQGR